MKNIILAVIMLLIPAAAGATEIALVNATAPMGQQNAGCKDSLHSCTDCHKFNEAKFKEITNTPDANIISTKMVNGMWEVVFEPQKGIPVSVVYSTLNGKNIFVGHLVNEKGESLTRMTALKYAQKTDFAKIPLENTSVVLGNSEAKNKIVVMYDLECPYCAHHYFEMKKLVSENPEYAVHVMMFPLPRGKAREKAEALVCAKDSATKQSLLESAFGGILSGNPVEPKEKADPSCDASVIDKTIKFGADLLKIKGTPFTVLSDGRMIEGMVDANTMKEIFR